MPQDRSLFGNLSTLARVLIAAGSLSLAGVLIAILSGVWDNDTTLSPADNYGPEETWFQLVFNDELDFNGSSEICVVGGMPQHVCNSLISYKDVSECKSVKLYDKLNPDKYLPEGMRVCLLWGKACNGAKPYGLIIVPANVKEIRVTNLNRSSENYEVFNMGVGDRMLAGHVNGLQWSVPE